ncbi:hypothetical protein HY991_04900 [Candidatus Micrarchaeota archaeon]|nr:hypothetical protein [Candidatus Micrarchaeota archaeon]
MIWQPKNGKMDYDTSFAFTGFATQQNRFGCSGFTRNLGSKSTNLRLMPASTLVM